MGKINSNIIFIIIILLMGGVIYYFVNENNKYKSELANRKQNEAALKGELITSKNKLGEVVKSKAILETERSELKNYSEELASEVGKLKEEVEFLSKFVIEIDNDEQSSVDDKVVDYGENVYGIEWEFIKTYNDENKRILRGLTKFRFDPTTLSISPLNSVLLRDYLNFSMITGLTTNKGITSGFGTSPLPGLNITNIKGWRKSESTSKTKNLGLSLYAGYGLTYSPTNSMIYHGPQVGGGLSLKIW
jgi:hypothetical protein